MIGGVDSNKIQKEHFGYSQGSKNSATFYLPEYSGHELSLAYTFLQGTDKDEFMKQEENQKHEVFDRLEVIEGYLTS